MSSVVLAKTASRQVLGVMNEFNFMAEHTISTGRPDPADLLGLSVWLANTIVGPISKDDGYTPLGVLQRVVATALPDSPARQPCPTAEGGRSTPRKSLRPTPVRSRPAVHQTHGHSRLRPHGNADARRWRTTKVVHPLVRLLRATA